MRLLLIFLAILSVAACADPQNTRRINPESISLPLQFTMCATREAAKYARERPDWSHDVLAGFARAQCQGALDEYVAGLNLGYADRVYVTSSLNRRAELQALKIAIDAKITAIGDTRTSASQPPAGGRKLTEAEDTAIEAWAGCTVKVLNELRRTGMGAHQITDRATARCSKLWIGTPGRDREITLENFKKALGEGGGNASPIVVGPPQPLPPVDKRM